MSHTEHHTAEEHKPTEHHSHDGGGHDTHADTHEHHEAHDTHTEHSAPTHSEVDHAAHSVAVKAVEALGIGSEAHPQKLWPISLVAKTVRDIGAILDAGVLKYFEGIGQAVSTSYHDIGNAQTTGKSIIETGNAVIKLADATVIGIARSIQGMYTQSKDLVTHLSAGTLDWLWTPGRMLWNGIKRIWNLPTTIFEKLSKKSVIEEHEVPHAVQAHH